MAIMIASHNTSHNMIAIGNGLSLSVAQKNIKDSGMKV